FCQSFEFAPHFAFVGQDEGLIASARRQAGQFFQGGGRRAETRQQISEGDGTDILGARQPQPGAAFTIVHVCPVFLPMRGSSPLSRRRILAWCIATISTESISAITA